MTPRRIDARENPEIARQWSVVYKDTGLDVADVFIVDLDEGYCWQYVIDSRVPKMDGPNIAMRRLKGDFELVPYRRTT